MGLRYFNQTCTHDVKNLVIIDTRQSIGQFDELTHFNVLRGRDQVQDFLANEARYPNPRVKWIDYKSQELFHQLRAGEIAEILYLAHMNQQLHSPFFYKLQNNYI
ncbi:hypothetical protein AWM75_03915 [Aerococcus urinaehominis]|uniref:Uncharacterized protein n=2 Tax=Aerococcus urinaehominis TaxID=128944 RepID=A0A0X8FM64_9LACT|nr:hypothetical protein AWM75_03915 [Aerococcus urinaehominis]